MSRIILDCSFSLFTEAGSRGSIKSNPELTHVACVTSQLALADALTLTSETGITGVCHTHLPFI